MSKFSILHCDFFFRPGFHGVVDLMVLLRSSEFNQDLITWLQGFLGSKRETCKKNGRPVFFLPVSLISSEKEISFR